MSASRALAVRHHRMRVVVVGHGFALFRREQRENRAAPKRELSALHGRDRACRALLGITGGKKWHLAGPFRREQIGRFDARLVVQSATEKYGRVDTIWTLPRVKAPTCCGCGW